MIKCPCKECEWPRRTSTCHIEGHCPEHDEWHRQMLELREKKHMMNMKRDLPRETMHKWWKKMKG